jgi:outer membrane lipoprotein-sorting protein
MSLLVFLLMAANGFGQTATPAPSPADLKTVLAQMDEGTKRFKSGQADLKSDTYTALVKDTEVKTGKIFSRHKNSHQEVAIRILQPHPLQVLIQNGKAIIYDPKIKEVTERSIGDKANAESITNMASPFGINGQDLLRDNEVKLIGWETVDGIRTAKLELVPRNESVKQKLFSKVILWIDVQRDVALQQQRFAPDPGTAETDRDYQLAHYTNIVLNGRISDDVFTIKKGGSGD